MLDFWPYLIFRLYLSRMQKYAFFFRLCKHSRGNPSPAHHFFYNKIQATEETKIRQLRKQKSGN